MGQIIGQHHAHMIPRGLPGEGNILLFDNGGFAGYGAPNPGAPTGFNNALRDYSRVLEFDPVSLEVVWKYSPVEAGFLAHMDNHNYIYRAYRVLYEWVSQLEKPREKSIPTLDNSRFRIPGSECKKEKRVTEVEGVRGFNPEPQLCVITLDE